MPAELKRGLITLKRKAALIIILLILLLHSLSSEGCASTQDFDRPLNSIVQSYRFSIAVWEITTFPREVSQWIQGKEENIANPVDIVTAYFSTTEERRRYLEDAVERILENQIEETLIQQDIFGFPPVNFKLENLPYLLVISPRDRIESIREILLQHNISLEEVENIEDGVDRLSVSSLVVELSGYGGAYPSLVTNDASLRSTIDTAVEEWLHQYLAFKPLGFRYVLDLIGVARNYDIATMNETATSMVSKEITSIIYDNYYLEQDKDVEQVSQSGFDFNREMREIRKAVDAYLARGEVELAEEFMEQKRQYLASKGHYIRKLNQAYFAWHGTYADRPTSVSPIGDELRDLRNQSASLKDFLDTIAQMTSHQDLLAVLAMGKNH